MFGDSRAKCKDEDKGKGLHQMYVPAEEENDVGYSLYVWQDTRAGCAPSSFVVATPLELEVQSGIFGYSLNTVSNL